MGPLFQIFLIFQLLFGGGYKPIFLHKVVNGYWQKSCKLCNSHWFAYMMRKWLFSGQKCQNIFWNFHCFHFTDLSVCFSANFQLLGTELVSNVYVWPILPSPLAITPFWPNGPFTYKMPRTFLLLDLCCSASSRKYIRSRYSS